MIKKIAFVSGQCKNLGRTYPVEILSTEGRELVDPFGQRFILVMVSTQGWYTWAIKGINTNYNFTEGV